MRTKLSATARSMDADNPPEISDDNFVSPSTARSNDGSGWPTQHRQFGEKMTILVLCLDDVNDDDGCVRENGPEEGSKRMY